MATGVDPRTFVMGTEIYVRQKMECKKIDSHLQDHLNTGILFPWQVDTTGTCSIANVDATKDSFSIMEWLDLIAMEKNGVLPTKGMFKVFFEKYGQILASMLHFDPLQRPHPQVLLDGFTALDL
mmetsp:Transcript_90811/g.257122  ORF Transcript_90811/g.257122 Transcript_90811/m.257122 type:complete len:124 (-) Transcript_90811:68-439(-)